MRNCVLIIEHDPSVSRFMQLKLEEEGFSCLIDNTGEAAVDLAGQRQVDLILLDPDEPLKGGHEILGKVREISSLPIIYLSSDTSVDAKVEALNAGADDYMTKPFNNMELVARVKSATKNRKLSWTRPSRSVISPSIRNVMKYVPVMKLSISQRKNSICSFSWPRIKTAC